MSTYTVPIFLLRYYVCFVLFYLTLLPQKLLKNPPIKQQYRQECDLKIFVFYNIVALPLFDVMKILKPLYCL